MAAPACKRSRRFFQRSDEPILTSFVNTADTSKAVQLRQGFYAVEAQSWRWTSKHFQVALAPPRRQAGHPVQLVLRFALPEFIVNDLKSIQLSAVINGFQLAFQTYSQSGQFTYIQDVPPDQLSGDTIFVDFNLDKAVPPSATDHRELGVIVSQVGLVSK